MQQTFLELLRLGAGLKDPALVRGRLMPEEKLWDNLMQMAAEQGLTSVAMDGMDCLLDGQEMLLVSPINKWIASTLRVEGKCAAQWETACQWASRAAKQGIRTYVLKGAVEAECYPRPGHRRSSDFDCFLCEETGGGEAWERGNAMVQAAGYVVQRNHYKNSTWFLPDLMVENHRFLTPFRGNHRLKALERLLQKMIRSGEGATRFEGTDLYRPPVMVSAIFLIEHSYTHFLHEGLAWRYVMDWLMFSSRHRDEIDWDTLNGWIDVFGFRRFYDAFRQMARLLTGQITEADLSASDRRMLEDIWAPLALHKNKEGLRKKLSIMRNTLRASWKYRLFTPLSMPHALWIQLKGAFFMWNPTLD